MTMEAYKLRALQNSCVIYWQAIQSCVYLAGSGCGNFVHYITSSLIIAALCTDDRDQSSLQCLQHKQKGHGLMSEQMLTMLFL